MYEENEENYKMVDLPGKKRGTFLINGIEKIPSLSAQRYLFLSVNVNTKVNLSEGSICGSAESPGGGNQFLRLQTQLNSWLNYRIDFNINFVRETQLRRTLLNFTLLLFFSFTTPQDFFFIPFSNALRDPCAWYSGVS